MMGLKLAPLFHFGGRMATSIRHCDAHCDFANCRCADWHDRDADLSLTHQHADPRNRQNESVS